MANFVQPTNVIVVQGSPDVQDGVTEGTMTEMKPGRLVKKGTTDAQVVIGAADGLSFGWLSFEDSPVVDRPATIATAFAVAKKCTVVNKPGIHVIGYGSAAIAKGARVSADAAGKVITFADATMDPDTIVGIAEESITEAGNIRIRSLI